MTTRREFLSASAAGLAGLAWAPSAQALERTAAGDASRPQATGTGLVYDDRYLDHVLPMPPGQVHPERPLRLVRIREEFVRRGLDEHLTRIPLLTSPRPFIEAHHAPDHVASVRTIPVTAGVAELAVAGALGAVEAVASAAVRNAFCASRPPGHHANNTGREEGFCFYSNAAIAAKYAQAVHGFERVLIIDWDYHHGNATQNAFYDDPSVLFFSTHDWRAYPGTGDPQLTGSGDGTGLNINADLQCGARDGDMLAHWDRLLAPAVASFRPDFVLVSAGFDSRMGDLLGCFALTDDVFRRMTRWAMDLAEEHCEGRLVSLLEGGYNVDGSALAAAAHVETLIDGA
jgi:acetoin utilization deacetylase AcuC-like enzyme